MKKAKSQWKQLTRQILALGLAVVLVSGMTDFSVLAKDAEKPTVTSEGAVAEKTAENPVEEDTEVETTSGNTVALLKSKVQEAEPEDDEAGIAVQADDDTTSDLIEVKVGSDNISKYSTFTDAMKAVGEAVKENKCKITIKLLADVEDIDNVNLRSDSIYNPAYITVDLNGHTLGSETEWGSQKKNMRFSRCNVTLKDSAANSNSMSYMHFCIDDKYSTITVESGKYDIIAIFDGGSGIFKGGYAKTLQITGDGSSCTVTNGEYGSISVSDASRLEISGENTTVDSLSVSTKTTATVTGGTYRSISNGIYGENGNLSNIVKDPYVLISTDESTVGEILNISGKSSVKNVKVAKVTGDRTAPTWTANGDSGDHYGIQVKGTWYNSLPDTVSFAAVPYNDKTLDMTIRANDENGVTKYYYYIQTITENSATCNTLTEEKLDALDRKVTDATKGFKLLSGNGTEAIILPDDFSKKSITTEQRYIIYAYAVDQVGNRSSYISTEGIGRDNRVFFKVTPPYEKNGEITDTQATYKIDISEKATLLYFCLDEAYCTEHNLTYGNEKIANDTYKSGLKSIIDNYIQSHGVIYKEVDGRYTPAIKASGEMVDVTGTGVKLPVYMISLESGTTPFTVTGLKADEKYSVWIIAIDAAGNQAGLVAEDAKTLKTLPKIATLPTISGFYGDYAKVTTEGVAVDEDGNFVEGTWNCTNTRLLPDKLNADGKIKVTFTPTSGTYDKDTIVVMYVTPTIKKRPVTVYAYNLDKKYLEDLPDIKFYVTPNEKGESPLLDLSGKVDTADKVIKPYLKLHTEVTKDSDAGEYPFTVTFDNPDSYYDVNIVYYNTNDDHGILTVEKLDSQIKMAEKEKTIKMGETLSLAESITTVPERASLEYVVHSDIVNVSSDGIVTPLKVGKAYVTIQLLESDNYKSTSKSVIINVEKGDCTVPEITKTYLYNQRAFEKFTVKSLLPENCGDVTCTSNSSDIEDTDNILELHSIGNIVDYSVKGGTIGTTAKITLKVTSDNYNINQNTTTPGQIIVKVVLVDRTLTELQGNLALKSSTLTYGQALSELKFGDNTFVDKVTKNPVPGTLAWSTPNVTPEVGDGTYEAGWIFTPTDKKNYMECTGKVKITVNKATPKVVSVPDPGTYTYSPLVINDNVLNNARYKGYVVNASGYQVDGTWSWVESNLVPNVGQGTYEVLFTPASSNYNTVKSKVTLTVKKATPYIQTPPFVNKEYVHGDFLENKDLQPGIATAGVNGPEIAGEFSWVYAGTKLSYVENTKGKKYEYLFWPDDTENYELKYDSITLTVNRADYPPQKPGNLNVKNSCKTLREVQLPTDWKFVKSSQVDLDAEMEIGKEISVEVMYLGEDRDNYVNTNVAITVTRSSCDHEKTERREIVKATCIAEGNTGYLWCLECNTKLEEGTVTPKDPTNHTALTSKVIKQPTTSEEGIMEYTCSACGYSATKAIAKIVSTSSSSGSSSGSQSNNDDKPAPTPTPTPAATPVPAVTPVRPNRIPVKPTVKEEPKAPAPFLRGENGKEGWAVITETVTEAEDGDTVIVDMNGSSVVPGDVFDRIRGKDITVEFDLGNGILWKVNGQSVEKGNVGDIDFTVRAGEDANDTIPLEIINNLTGERTYMNLSLAYEGEFGFEAVLSLNVGTANAGLYANLFYYNEATKELEFLCAGEIGQDGGAELTFTHASEYTIVIDEQPMETDQSQEVTSETGVQDNQEDNTVNIAPEVENTGHTALLIFCIILIAAAFIVIGVIVFVKKNKKEE